MREVILSTILPSFPLPREAALVCFDHEGALCYASPEAQALWGFDQAAMPSQWSAYTSGSVGLAQLIQQRAHQELRAATARSPWALQIAWRLMPLEGHPPLILGHAHRVFSPAGLDSQAMLELVEALPIGLVLFHSGGDITLANATARALLHRDVTWRSVFEVPAHYTLHSDELAQEIMCPLQQAVTHARMSDRLALYVDAGQGVRKRVSFTVAPFPPSPTDDNPRYLLAVLEDLTAQHARERFKDELLTIASHELRNPLTPLKGLLQLASQQHARGQPLDASLLHKAEAQVSRLVKLANRLLDLSRLEAGHSGPPRERLDLRRPIEDTLDLWTARHDEARFHIELPAQPCMVECDRGGIEQVLTNLIDNALKFSPSEAPITIRLSIHEDRAWVVVEDQGVGIDARSLEHIFDRFYQAEHGRKRQGGFGLGLYISRKIIEDHAGEIEIQSREGGPTRVTFRLPLLQH